MKKHLIAPLLLSFSGSAFSAVYSAGHGDIGIAYEDEGNGPEFFLHYHLGATATVDGSLVGNAPDGLEFEPGDITTTIPSSTMMVLPNNAALNTGTGVAAGGAIWILPQAEQDGLPFLGIATEELAAADWTGNITFSMGAVTSPSGRGNFSLWNADGFGDVTFFYSTNSPGSTEDGNVLTLPTGTHAHFNYGFSEPGTWDVELTVAGTHVTDGALSSTRNFTFNVVPEPSSALLAALGGLALSRRRRV